MRPSVIGKPNLPRHWLRTCVGDEKAKSGRSWYVDETYIRVRGGWRYLYRAIDRAGALVDVMLSEHRDLCRRQGLLSIGKGGDRRNPGSGHHGRPRCLSQGNPDRAWPPCAASDKSLSEQPT